VSEVATRPASRPSPNSSPLSDRDLTDAVTKGHLHPGEEPAAAVERHHAADDAAQRQLDDLTARRTDLRRRRDELSGHERRLQQRRQQLGYDREQPTARHRALTDRIEELAGDEQLCLLAAADVVDVLAEGRDLIPLLGEQIVRADRRRVEIAVQGAEDERAAAALQTTGCCRRYSTSPPPLDELAAAEIASTSGWNYLADSVPAVLRGAVLAAAPALAGGVLVHNPTT
jgi:hypothetical protein